MFAKLRSIFLILASLWILMPRAQALDFKGVVMGEPADAAALNEKLGPPNPLGVHTTQLEGLVVFTRVTLQGANVVKLDVEFLPAQFDTIAAAATKKWGKAKAQKIPMQNGFGAQFQNTMLSWERDGWTVYIARYVDADSGSLWIERTKPAAAISPKDRL